MTAPGVGPVTALSYRATLDRLDRFPDAGQMTAYLGLVPREDSSAERRHRGAITKAGPSQPRSLLVQASWHIRRCRRGAAALHAWVHRVAARRGCRIAMVALARRLARCLYAMWRDGRDFDGARQPMPAAASPHPRPRAAAMVQRMAWQPAILPGRTSEPKDRSCATPASPIVRRR